LTIVATITIVVSIRIWCTPEVHIQQVLVGYLRAFQDNFVRKLLPQRPDLLSVQDVPPVRLPPPLPQQPQQRPPVAALQDIGVLGFSISPAAARAGGCMAGRQVIFA
jgi:hypothetical protein